MSNYFQFQPLRVFMNYFVFIGHVRGETSILCASRVCAPFWRRYSKPKIELVCLLYPKYINFPQSTSMTWHLVEGKGIKIKPSSEMAGLAHIIWHIYSSRCNNFPNWMSYDWHYAWCAMCSGLSSPVLLDVLADFARMFQLLRLTHVWN